MSLERLRKGFESGNRQAPKSKGTHEFSSSIVTSSGGASELLRGDPTTSQSSAPSARAAILSTIMALATPLRTECQRFRRSGDNTVQNYGKDPH